MKSSKKALLAQNKRIIKQQIIKRKNKRLTQKFKRKNRIKRKPKRKKGIYLRILLLL